jgi:hypothetical protein
MDDGLEVTVGRSDGCVEVSFGGEIDIATVDRFRRALRDAIFEAEDVVDLNLIGSPSSGRWASTLWSKPASSRSTRTSC